MELTRRFEERLQISEAEASERVANLVQSVSLIAVVIVALIVAFFWPGGGTETAPVLVDNYVRGGSQLLEADGQILTLDRLVETSKGEQVTIQIKGSRVYYTVSTDNGQDQFAQLLPNYLRFEIKPGDWEIVGTTIEARYTRSLSVVIGFFLILPIGALAITFVLINNNILRRRASGRSLSVWWPPLTCNQI